MHEDTFFVLNRQEVAVKTHKKTNLLRGWFFLPCGQTIK